MTNIKAHLQKAAEGLVNNPWYAIYYTLYLVCLDFASDALFSIPGSNPVGVILILIILLLAALLPILYFLFKRRKYIKLLNLYCHDGKNRYMERPNLFRDSPIRLYLYLEPGPDVENATITIEHPRGVSIAFIYTIEGCSYASSDTLFCIEMVRGTSTKWDFVMEVEATTNDLPAEFQLVIKYQVDGKGEKLLRRKTVAFDRDP